MLSSAYQQSSRSGPQALASDPDNRLFGRMNRRRLDAEAIRDSLLAVAGRLDATPGGPAFADLAVPRRTLYLQSVRTGPGAGRLRPPVRPGRSRLDRRRPRRVGRGPAGPVFPERPVRERDGPGLAARIASEEPAADRGPHPAALRPGPGPASVAGRARPRHAISGRAKPASTPGNGIAS